MPDTDLFLYKSALRFLGPNMPVSIECGDCIDRQRDPASTHCLIHVGLDVDSFSANYVSPAGVLDSMRLGLESGPMALGLIVDHWRRALYGKPYQIHVHNGIVGRLPVVVARKSSEPPFDTLEHYPAGYYVYGQPYLFIRADYYKPPVTGWKLGKALSDPVYSWENGDWHISMTHVIAHEMAHFLGFAHVRDTASMMAEDLELNPRWTRSTDSQFRYLASKVTGGRDCAK